MFTLSVVLSMNLTRWIVVVYCGWNPNYLGLTFDIICILSLERRSFSNSLTMVLWREIDRWFVGIFGSFYGFLIIMMSVIFHWLGKNSSLQHALYILHRLITSFSSPYFKDKLDIRSGNGAILLWSLCSVLVHRWEWVYLMTMNRWLLLRMSWIGGTIRAV